jgi:hypothetical protein
MEPLNILIPALIALAVARRGFTLDDAYLRAWAASAGVTLTVESRPAVRRYLAWTRRSRTVGGLVGFLAPILYRAASGETSAATTSGGADWSVPLMIVGYLVGALVAEIVVNRPRRGTGAALLVPRRLADYLPPYVLRLQRGLAVAAAVLAGVYALLVGRVSPATNGLEVPDALEVLAFGVGGAGIALLVETVQRAIVARRQPVGRPDEQLLDDAMRSSSLHVLAGAGVGLLCIVVGGNGAVLAALGGSIGRWVGLAVALGGFAAGISFWLDLAKPHGFRVRRRVREKAPA